MQYMKGSADPVRKGFYARRRIIRDDVPQLFRSRIRATSPPRRFTVFRAYSKLMQAMTEFAAACFLRRRVCSPGVGTPLLAMHILSEDPTENFMKHCIVLAMNEEKANDILPNIR